MNELPGKMTLRLLLILKAFQPPELSKENSMSLSTTAFMLLKRNASSSSCHNFNEEGPSLAAYIFIKRDLSNSSTGARSAYDIEARYRPTGSVAKFFATNILSHVRDCTQPRPQLTYGVELPPCFLNTLSALDDELFPPNMAFTDLSSIQRTKQDILEQGFSCHLDPVIGERVDAIAQKGFPFKTEEGLDFCKLNTVDDERVRLVLESFFEWSGLGFYRTFGYDLDRTFSFLNNVGPVVNALFVQLWSSGSRVMFYKGSHLRSLDPRPSGNGLFEIPKESLTTESVQAIDVEMRQGGLTIIDARLGFKILHGRTITLGFATKDELREWATMKLSYSDRLRRRVEAMTTEKIGTNFEFLDSPTSSQSING